MTDRIRSELENEKVELLLQEYAEEEGRKLIQENQRLQNDSAFSVPDSFSQTWRKTLEKEAKKEQKKLLINRIQKSLKHVAILAVALLAIGGTMFISVDAFRFRVLNALISHKDTNIRVDITEAEELEKNDDVLTNIWLPDGFFHVFSDNTLKDFQIHYFQNSAGDEIELFCISAFEGTYNIDSEKTEFTDEVEINGNKGLVAIKDSIHISWFVPEKSMWCDIYCTLEISLDDAIKIARSVY